MKKVTMSFKDDTIIAVDEIQSMLNHKNKTSSVAAAVKLSRDVIGFATSGGGTLFTPIDGVMCEIKITPKP